MTSDTSRPHLFILLLILAFSVAVSAQSRPQRPDPTVSATPVTQAEDFAKMRQDVLDLASKGQHLKSLPLVEKVAKVYSKDAKIWAIYGIAVLANSVTQTDREIRQREIARGKEILVRARELGTDDVSALEYLDRLEKAGDDSDDNYADSDPEFEKAIRAGEAFFGNGEYDKAIAEYEKANKRQPKNYEAVLYIGDAFYAQKKYDEAITWFAKAVDVDPDREPAYRYWGDALMYQDKPLQARDKFIEAFIAEPFVRNTSDRLSRWVQETGTPALMVDIIPPGTGDDGDFKVNDALLKIEDGTSHWKLYNDAVKTALAAKPDRYTLASEVSALRIVAVAARKDISSGKIKDPHLSLTNLIKIDDAGLLEAYVLFVHPKNDFGPDFFEYRKLHRDKMRQFVVQFLLGLSR